ncbi:phosphoribosyltransferase family protein [Isoptericola sp. NPDC057191]|uniref:phosphoribosyltransferase family protein n=1 Tax=Isoptericola sp. NPDC057191 TaxID=3346041 RepID=UPI003639C22B
MTRVAVSRLERTALGALRMVGDAGDLDPHAYSRFKHGDGDVSRQYGALLAEVLAPELACRRPERLVVTSSGFDVVPPAAHSLVAPFTASLRERLGHAVTVTVAKVRRLRPSDGDYATMDTARRRASILDALDTSSTAAQFAGAHVIALDDVVVTGLHERAMDTALKGAGAASVQHAYVVDASAFRGEPQVEAQLNHGQIRTVDDLVVLAASPGFVPNARVARLLLGAPVGDLRPALGALPSPVVTWLTEVALGDPLAALPRFRAGASTLRDLVGQPA